MDTIAFPPEMAGLLLGWYSQSARDLPWRHTRDPYAIWISEIMLQQTQVDTVIPYYRRFLERLPTLEALAAAPLEQVLKLWEGLGYYTRARNLHRCARAVAGGHGGVFPREYPAVRALPGIGDYTAGAILSIAFEQPEPAVDGNVLRVAARVLDIRTEMSAPAVKKRVTEGLRAIYPPHRRGDFTQSLMELGATVCVPGGQPACGACPLGELCLGRQRGTAPQLPAAAAQKARRVEEITVFILEHGGLLALARRGEAGLLAGLWELPNLPGRLEGAAAWAALEAWGLDPQAVGRPAARKHVFTHVEWRMACYPVACARAGGPFQWVSRAELSAAYPLPTAFRKCLPAAK